MGMLEDLGSIEAYPWKYAQALQEAKAASISPEEEELEKNLADIKAGIIEITDEDKKKFSESLQSIGERINNSNNSEEIKGSFLKKVDEIRNLILDDKCSSEGLKAAVRKAKEYEEAHGRIAPRGVNIPGDHKSNITTYLPPIPGNTMNIEFHGNMMLAKNMESNMYLAAALGQGSILAEYPGYGNHKGGIPIIGTTKSAVTKAADRIVRFLNKKEGISLSMISANGTSIGSVAATHIASKYDIGAIKLDCPLASAKTLIEGQEQIMANINKVKYEPSMLSKIMPRNIFNNSGALENMVKSREKRGLPPIVAHVQGGSHDTVTTMRSTKEVAQALRVDAREYEGDHCQESVAFRPYEVGQKLHIEVVSQYQVADEKIKKQAPLLDKSLGIGQRIVNAITKPFKAFGNKISKGLKNLFIGNTDVESKIKTRRINVTAFDGIREFTSSKMETQRASNRMRGGFEAVAPIQVKSVNAKISPSTGVNVNISSQNKIKGIGRK